MPFSRAALSLVAICGCLLALPAHALEHVDFDDLDCPFGSNRVSSGTYREVGLLLTSNLGGVECRSDPSRARSAPNVVFAAPLADEPVLVIKFVAPGGFRAATTDYVSFWIESHLNRSGQWRAFAIGADSKVLDSLRGRDQIAKIEFARDEADIRAVWFQHSTNRETIDSLSFGDLVPVTPRIAGASVTGLDGLLARDVSGDGSTVVGPGPSRWTAEEGVIALATPAPVGAGRSEAFGVSRDGTVAAGRDAALDRAAVWIDDVGLFLPRPFPDGVLPAYATGVSGDGRWVVGYSAHPFPPQPFRWSRSTNTQPLAELVPGSESFRPVDISADGRVIVGSIPGSRAARWTEAGGVELLGSPPSSDPRSSAQAVSADGRVVVGSVGGNTSSEAFRWTRESGIQLLGRLPGANAYSVAYGASGDGSVVVGTSVANAPRGGRGDVGTAFIWDAVHGMRSLRHVLLDEYGLDATSLGMGTARAISDDGRVIVGDSWRIELPPSNQAPSADAGDDQTVECNVPGGAPVSLDGSGSFDPDGDPLSYAWETAGGPASGVSPTIDLPLGRQEVSLEVDDGLGGTDTDSVSVTVVDTAPPEIRALRVSPRILWPADRRWVSIDVVADASDVCDVAPRCRVDTVDVFGARDASDAWEAPGDLLLRLRAQSSFRRSRVYRVSVACSDASGNTATAKRHVFVPRKRRRPWWRFWR